MSFEETTKAVEGVEVLAGPLAVADDSGSVYATAQIQRVEQVDYKTKAPTGESLVFLIVSPLTGRKKDMRLKHAVDALRALNQIPRTVVVTDGKDGTEPVVVSESAVPLLKQGWKVAE